MIVHNPALRVWRNTRPNSFIITVYPKFTGDGWLRTFDEQSRLHRVDCRSLAIDDADSGGRFKIGCDTHEEVGEAIKILRACCPGLPPSFPAPCANCRPED